MCLLGDNEAAIIFTKPIDGINVIFNDLENHKKEIEVDFDPYYKAAPPAGLEPATL